MTILYFPNAIIPSESTWTLVAINQTFKSPIDQFSQAIAFPQLSYWKAELKFDFLTYEEHLILKSFISQLQGRENTFLMYNQRHIDRAQTSTTPYVTSYIGEYLYTDGWTKKEGIDYIHAGEYFTVNSGDYYELKIATKKVQGSGNICTINYQPVGFKKSSYELANHSLLLSTPYCKMQLEDNYQPKFTFRGGYIKDFTFSCVESFL